MKKIKDKKIIILALILVVFTICYFTIVNKVSYSFEDNYDFSIALKNKEDIITKCAEKYGKDNLESFSKEGLMYITVQNLVDNGCLIPNESGNIINLNDPKEFLNSKKIRIKNENEKISAEIYS